MASEKRYGRSRGTFHWNRLLLSYNLYMNLESRAYTINQIFAILLCRGRGKLHIASLNTYSSPAQDTPSSARLRVLLSEETHSPSSRHHRRPNLLLSFDLSDYIPTGTESTYQHQRLNFLQPLRSRVRELTFFPLVLSNPNTPTQKPQIPRHPKPPPTNPLNPAPTVELFQSRNAKREKRDDMVSRIERRREVVG